MVRTRAGAALPIMKVASTTAIGKIFFIWLGMVGRYATCGSGAVSVSEQRELSTHASLANHSCVSQQSGQCVRLKNTGVERKVAEVMYLPVEMARSVFGQRIIIMPMRNASPS